MHDSPAHFGMAAPHGAMRWRLGLYRLCWRWLARLLPARLNPPPPPPPPPQPAPRSSFLVTWLAGQPAQSAIVLTVDPKTGELLAIKSLPRKQLPEVLQVMHGADQANAWQVLGLYEMRRINFDAANILAEQEDRLITTEDLLAVQHTLLEELELSNAQLSDEIKRLRRSVTE